MSKNSKQFVKITWLCSSWARKIAKKIAENFRENTMVMDNLADLTRKITKIRENTTVMYITDI